MNAEKTKSPTGGGVRVGPKSAPPKGGKDPGQGGLTVKHPGKGKNRLGAVKGCC